ncbi:MAG TPA: cyclase family protein [Thermoanaerobaculia bacterium]|jgi:kynurenine formamidase|nr:cyclase family protein [Thermoanaerobaculia bacterium]
MRPSGNTHKPPRRLQIGFLGRIVIALTEAGLIPLALLSFRFADLNREAMTSQVLRMRCRRTPARIESPVLLVGQYGTHVDPPAHFRSDGMTMDEIPLKQMILPLVVFDITSMLAKDRNHALTINDISAWEKEHGRVPAGGFAALRTDMSKEWTSNPQHFKRSPFPAWSLAAIKFLFDERKVTALGHESLDTDTTEAMDSETWILKQNHFQIEAMANLDKVPPAGAVIVVTWPKVEQASASRRGRSRFCRSSIASRQETLTGFAQCADRSLRMT